jgi:ComF family protein
LWKDRRSPGGLGLGTAVGRTWGSALSMAGKSRWTWGGSLGFNSAMADTPILTQRARRAGAGLLNTLLPPRCLKCGITVDAVGALCPVCWPTMAFLAPPYCSVCGFPFEFDLGPGAVCAACAADPPIFQRARAVLRYDEASRDLILRFKHGDRTDAAPAFGQWLGRVGAELLADAELIVPVPLHWWRLFRRRYNQAALLSGALSRSSGAPAVNDLLVRRRATPSQGGLGAAQRRRNVAGAFAVHPRRRDVLAGRRVLLIDDVLTTGATVEACGRALLKAGARAVDVLTLARVVRPLG